MKQQQLIIDSNLHNFREKCGEMTSSGWFIIPNGLTLVADSMALSDKNGNYVRNNIYSAIFEKELR